MFSQENISEIGGLPNEVVENSGLLFYNGKLIAHNDSGNTAQLFEIDTLSLKIVRTVTIANAENVDWEDMAQDENYIYIGDFGNNNGDRQNLNIYRISKADYSVSTSILADKIEFSYEDQLDFSTTQNSDWDAEALVVLNNELIVFTKQWQSKGTVAYSVPKAPGVFTAINKGTYPIQGLVTGATINSLTNELFIVGYSQTLKPFIAIVSDVATNTMFNGTVQKTNLSIGPAQIEAIVQVNEDTFFISSEKFVNDSPPIVLDAKLFSFQVNNKIGVPEEEGSENEEVVEEENKETLVLYKAYGSDLLQYKLNTNDKVFGKAIFNSSGQRLVYTLGKDMQGGDMIDISTYETAIYYLTFYLQSGVVSKAFIKN